MRLGVCAPISDAAFIASLGFDYLEVNASAIAAMTDEEFAAFCEENEKSTHPCGSGECSVSGNRAFDG